MFTFVCWGQWNDYMCYEVISCHNAFWCCEMLNTLMYERHVYDLECEYNYNVFFFFCFVQLNGLWKNVLKEIWKGCIIRYIVWRRKVAPSAFSYRYCCLRKDVNIWTNTVKYNMFLSLHKLSLLIWINDALILFERWINKYEKCEWRTELMYEIYKVFMWRPLHDLEESWVKSNEKLYILTKFIEMEHYCKWIFFKGVNMEITLWIIEFTLFDYSSHSHIRNIPIIHYIHLLHFLHKYHSIRVFQSLKNFHNLVRNY